MKIGRIAVVGLAMGLWGCAAQGGPEDQDLSPRCLNVLNVGLVGLESVEVAGTPTISGPYGSVYSNEIVTLAGAYDLEGAAISGGPVVINGPVRPDGGVYEYAEKITVDDPTEAVRLAAQSNDNAKIPCVKRGKKCNSPLSGTALTLSSTDAVTLSSGTYYFTDIRINGQAKVNVSGEVVIYLDGPATFNGGSATNPDLDSLTIVSSSSEEIKLNGGAESAVHIFAPFATVRFAGTQGFVGTALGRELKINGTADIEVSDFVAGVIERNCDPGDAPTGTPPQGPK